MNIGVFFSKLVQKTEKPLSHGTINEYNLAMIISRWEEHVPDSFSIRNVKSTKNTSSGQELVRRFWIVSRCQSQELQVPQTTTLCRLFKAGKGGVKPPVKGIEYHNYAKFSTWNCPREFPHDVTCISINNKNIKVKHHLIKVNKSLIYMYHLVTSEQFIHIGTLPVLSGTFVDIWIYDNRGKLKIDMYIFSFLYHMCNLDFQHFPSQAHASDMSSISSKYTLFSLILLLVLFQTHKRLE